MNIEDAFTEGAIAAAGVDVGGDEENELREMLRKVLETTPELEINQILLNVCVLCFVAGRAFQVDQTVINVPMSPAMIAEFLEYLSEGGS